MNNKINIPEISNDLYEDMEMLLNQAEMTSGKARNTVDDMEEVAAKFILSLSNQATKEWVFWKLIDEYLYKQYNRPNHLRQVIHNTRPEVLLVYQLLNHGEVVYVGKSASIDNRLSSHSKNKQFDNVLLCSCSTEKEQQVLENSLIDLIRPPLNKSLNLQLVDRNLVIPNFTEISKFHLDFIPPTSNSICVKPHNHFYVNGLGFVSCDKVKNTPHWMK